jgi:hypothetical protein
MKEEPPFRLRETWRRPQLKESEDLLFGYRNKNCRFDT